LLIEWADLAFSCVDNNWAINLKDEIFLELFQENELIVIISKLFQGGRKG
jgi:hypothetical protein